MAKSGASEPMPFLREGHDFLSVSGQISDITLTRPQGKGYLAIFLVTSALTALMLVSILAVLIFGVGVWGVNNPVGWGFAILHLVWWIGIGHAGTLISAILLLLNQAWRMSISRFAEAMTLFAVLCAVLFPALHLGRPWLAYWLVPLPNTMNVWPQFRSALVWDIFAIATYGTVSALFWYLGLIPDLATLRDRARTRTAQVVYGILALGWRGAAKHWERYETAYRLLAGLATPLVVSVHTVVSFDFAISVVPGWHATIFPPYFVAGAIYCGFAMVLAIAIPLRVVYRLTDFITPQHLDMMAKVMLATGLFVLYGYAMEAFMGWYSANPYERYVMENRATGPYAPTWWLLILCNGVILQTLWLRRVRKSPVLLFLVCLVVNVGMWLERFVIVVISLHRDFMPSAWDMYYPTFWDVALYLGTLGFFLWLLLLFIRYLPMISMSEMRSLLPPSLKAHGAKQRHA